VAVVSGGNDLNYSNNTAGDPVAVAARAEQLGSYSNGYRLLDANGNYAWDGFPADASFSLGLSGTPLTGEWNGTGRKKVAVYANGTWRLDFNGDQQWDGPVSDREIYFGSTDAIPLVGDWNGDGNTKIGVYSGGFWFLDYNGDYLWQPGNPDKRID
jgi:hypothetical protein